MTKFKQGETSEAVIKRKEQITHSIVKKTELINAIMSIDDIYSTLSLKRNKISESAVHEWNDQYLEITSYSWNTARTSHNIGHLKALQKAIFNANNRLSSKNKKKLTNRDGYSTEVYKDNLKLENEELKNALAEVYRAYMMLINRIREDQLIDDASRNLILDQAKVLGKRRLSEVK